MKKSFIICIVIFCATLVRAQHPINWKYSTKKIADKVYEVHITAVIDDGWHLYAQQQPKSFIGSATTIRFNTHPLVVFKGKVKEVGALKKTKEPTLGIESWQYANEVDFVQQVTLKNNIKTAVTGNIEFQVCTDEKCLPPASVNFNIQLD